MSKNRKRGAAFAAALGALGLVAAACGSSSNASASSSSNNQSATTGAPSTTKGLTTVTVSILPGTVSAAFYLAQKDGYFTKNGLDVKTTSLYTGAQTIPAVINGELDIAAGGPSAVFFRDVGQSKGSLMVIGSQSRSVTWTQTNGTKIPHTSGFYVREAVANSINSPKGLEGQTIYVPTLGHQSQFYIYLYLKSAGLPISSIKWGIIPTASAGNLAALQTSRINVGLLIAPQSIEAVNKGIAKPLFLNHSVDPGEDSVLWTASGAFVKSNPAAVTGFIKAMKEANATYKAAVEAGSNSSQYQSIVSLVSSELKVPASSVMPLPGGLTTSVSTTDLSDVGSFFVSMGYVPKSDLIPTSQYVDCANISCVTTPY